MRHFPSNILVDTPVVPPPKEPNTHTKALEDQAQVQVACTLPMNTTVYTADCTETNKYHSKIPYVDAAIDPH